MGRHEEAEKVYGEAILVDKQLVDEFPKVPKYRSGLASDYNNLGGLLGLLHRFDEAEKADRAALAIRQQLVKDYPTIPDYRMELGDTLHNMGVKLVNQGTGRNQEAEESYRQAQKVYQQLVAEFPAVADYRRRLAGLGNNLGLCSEVPQSQPGGGAVFSQGDRDHRAACARRERLCPTDRSGTLLAT